MLPNTFIAGAQKGGTTTLCRALDSHFQAILSTPKEPAFFSRAANLDSPERYARYFLTSSACVPRAVVDGSNAYMVDPLVPSRICNMLGKELRFVFCLREPVARAISSYWHQAKKGREHRPLTDVLSFASKSLNDAVDEEEERIQCAANHGLINYADCRDRFDDPLWNFRYLRNSLYFADLERFRAVFGVARVKVLLFEELVHNPVATLKKMAVFLDLDPEGFPGNLDLHRNATSLVRAPTLINTLRLLPGRHLLRHIPGYEQVRGTFFNRPPPADPAIRESLRKLIAPAVIRLETLLNRDLGRLWGYE